MPNSPDHQSQSLEQISTQQILRDCNIVIEAGEKDSPRFTLDYFADIYPENVIQADKIIVIKIENGFTKENKSQPNEVKIRMELGKKKSDALESILAKGVESYNWFGQWSYLSRGTKYDDYTAGADAIVEFDIEDGENPERIVLAIDTTSHNDHYSINRKISRNILRIHNNELMVKYYESPNQHPDRKYKGPLINAVPVVIGLEDKNSSQLIKNFSQLIQLSQKINDQNIDQNERALAARGFSALRHRIEKDPIQLIFLDEIRDQLSLYVNFLKKENNPDNINVKIASVEKLLTIINSIFVEKIPISASYEMDSLKKDRAYQSIKTYCKTRSKEFTDDESNIVPEDPDGTRYL